MEGQVESVTYCIKECLGLTTDKKPISLNKKDDDLSQNEILQWEARYPVGPHLKNFTCEEVNSYVIALFKDLSKIDIHSSNMGAIGTHLRTIGIQNQRIRDLCLKKIQQLNCPQEEKDFLSIELAYSISDYP